jgi:hypothetical protein
MAVEVRVAPSIIVLADEFVELSLQFANMQVRVGCACMLFLVLV